MGVWMIGLVVVVRRGHRNKLRRKMQRLEEGRFTHADYQELVKMAEDQLDVRESWSMDQANRRKQELRQARLDGVVEGQRKAYEDFAEAALGKAARVQMLALDAVLQGATLPDGSVDPKLVDQRSLKAALGVAKELSDRVLGKAVQKSESKVEHNFLMRLAEEGVLDD